MTRILLILAAACVSIEIRAQVAGGSTNQDAPRAVIEAAAVAMGTTSLQSIQYSGTGTNNTVGQAFAPGGPWPQFTVTKYVASVNYLVPVMRQEIVRVDNISPPRGGGAGPFSPATGQGGIRPIPGDIIQNQNIDGRTEAGAITIWLTPHGFLKGATASAATAALATSRGKRVVSFTAFGKYSVSGTIGEGNLVERVETRIDNGFLGDMLVEAIYSEYTDFAGVKFPTRILQRQGGHSVLDITVAAVQPNFPPAIDLRGGILGAGRAGPVGPGGSPTPLIIQTERIADGLWFLNSGAPQSLLVEFSDHLVVIEAPTGDERSLATIAEAKRMFPAKPIRYLVNTHHHADHAGGLRAYVAEGVRIITHQAQKRYYEQEIVTNPHTLNPDRLARNPRAPIVEAMGDKRVLTDGTMTLELHLVRGNLHSEGLLMAYVPREKLLIQADAFAPRPGVPPLPAPSPYTVNLVDNIRRLKLDVTRVAHVHGGIDTFETVVKAAGGS
jgi:glyoxylase-like metal-dependent hydrolase (beta-lactamase superfamily II)